MFVVSALLLQGFAISNSMESRLARLVKALENTINVIDPEDDPDNAFATMSQMLKDQEYTEASSHQSRGARGASDQWKMNLGYNCARTVSAQCNTLPHRDICLEATEIRNKVIEGRQIQGQICVWIDARSSNKCQPINHPVVDNATWKQCKSESTSYYATGRPDWAIGVYLLSNIDPESTLTRCYSTQRCKDILMKENKWYEKSMRRQESDEWFRPARDQMPTMIEGTLRAVPGVLKYLSGPAPDFIGCEASGGVEAFCDIRYDTCMRMECGQSGGTIDWSTLQACPGLTGYKTAWCQL